MTDLDFLLSLLTIIGVDIILGGDNAILVALACRNLPEHLRNKAIILGIMFAILTRIILTVIAVYLLQIPYLLALGGGLLLFIAYNLLVDDNDLSSISGKTTLLAAIKTIVVADLVMGFDNVVAVAGAAQGNTLLVMIGLLISIPIIIWGSKVILKTMEKYPIIIYFGAGILAYTAGRMITNEEKFSLLFTNHPFIGYSLQILFVIAILASGWISNRGQSKNVTM